MRRFLAQYQHRTCQGFGITRSCAWLEGQLRHLVSASACSLKCHSSDHSWLHVSISCFTIFYFNFVNNDGQPPKTVWVWIEHEVAMDPQTCSLSARFLASPRNADLVTGVRLVDKLAHKRTPHVRIEDVMKAALWQETKLSTLWTLFTLSV